MCEALERSILAPGWMEKCMVKENLLEMTGGFTKVSIFWMKNMDGEFMVGRMIKDMKGIGIMENSMDKELFTIKKVKPDMEYGLMESS